MEGQVPGNFFVRMSPAGIEPVGFRVKSDLRNHQAIVQPRLSVVGSSIEPLRSRTAHVSQV
jgi:hypothetical protein